MSTVDIGGIERIQNISTESATMCFRNEFATKTTKLTGYFAMALFDALLAGCTSVEVRSVDAGLHSIDHVCIKENPRVNVADFGYIMEDIFSEHGISSEVFDGTPPNDCEYVVTYTARRSWNVVPYLSYAEVKDTQRQVNRCFREVPAQRWFDESFADEVGGNQGQNAAGHR
jgi:hypothetical protein